MNTRIPGLGASNVFKSKGSVGQENSTTPEGGVFVGVKDKYP